MFRTLNPLCRSLEAVGQSYHPRTMRNFQLREIFEDNRARGIMLLFKATVRKFRATRSAVIGLPYGRCFGYLKFPESQEDNMSQQAFSNYFSLNSLLLLLSALSRTVLRRGNRSG
jgi:hypothetical protein